MEDFLLIDTLDGADLQLQSGDVATTSDLATPVYLSLLGGDKWWANALVSKAERYTGATVTLLRSLVLNSAGRLRLIDAVKQDLKLLEQQLGVQAVVNVTISSERADIHITIAGSVLHYEYASGQFLIVN